MKKKLKLNVCDVEKSYLFFTFFNLNIYWSSNRIINQKYFYNDIELHESFLIKTKEKIKINKKQKIELEKYLKEKNIDIKYFENFEGHIFSIRVEWFDKKQDIYLKKIYIHFFNSLLKLKIDQILIINIENEIDIEIILILLKNYFNDVEKVFIKKKFLNISFFKKLNSNIYINPILNYNCQQLLDYFLEYKKLIIYYKTKLLLNEDDFKDFLYLQIKENFNIEKYEILFKNNESLYELYKKNKEFFNNFKGSVFLMEFNIVENKKKLKKYVLIFLNELNWKWRVFYLFDVLNLDFVLNILKMPWIEDNYLFDEIHRNMIRNFVRTNTSLYKNDDEYFLNIRNSTTVILKNKEELVYYIEYYKLFL